MLITETLQTNAQPTSADSMSDGELTQHLAAFDAEMHDDQLCNFPNMWRVAKELQGQDITSDAFVVALALASLTKNPRIGTRANHKQIARRASALKKLFAISEKVGWPKIMVALGITEGTTR
jgi:hypothetical protein